MDSETISVEQTLVELKIAWPWLRRLMASGRLGYIEIDGEPRLHRTEVEAYKYYQRNWNKRRVRMRKGMYIIGPTRQKMQVTQALRREPRPEDGKPLHHDRWASAQEAANILNLTTPRVSDFADAGLLTRSYAKTRDTEDRSDTYGDKYRRAWYRLSDVIRLQADRESREKSISPGKWRETTNRPVIRWPAVAPPNDRLITRDEACAILEISKGVLHKLYQRGRLFIWQENPGRAGSRIWLSENQVCRYRDDPSRLRRRALQGGEASGPDPDNPLADDQRIWLEDRNLRPGRANLDREHGEYFTGPQAARALGICRNSVVVLRLNGRLAGYKLNEKEHNRNAWWFYKKDDVYSLMSDPQYRKYHAIGKQSQANRVRPEPPPQEKRPEWEEWKGYQEWRIKPPGK